jgi:hypothetical protein
LESVPSHQVKIGESLLKNYSVVGKKRRLGGPCTNR